MKYSTNAKRYMARSVDGLALAVSLFALLWFFSALADSAFESLRRENFFALAILCAGILFFFYMIGPLKMRGATLGMSLFDQRLVRVDGKPLTWATVIKREFFSVVSTFAYGFGYWSALWHKKNQTWHDRWAGTVVVQTEK